MEYICTKALNLGGVDYGKGDAIPTEAVLPKRERALIRLGYIAAATTAPPSAEPPAPLPPAELPVPLITKDGTQVLALTPEEAAGILAMLQLTAEEVIAAIAEMSEACVMLVDRLDGRKTVKEAARARLETMKAANPSADPDGKPSDEGAGEA